MRVSCMILVSNFLNWTKMNRLKFAIVTIIVLIAAGSLYAEEIVPLDVFLARIAETDTVEDAKNWTAIADEVFILYEDESFTDFKSRSTRTVRYTYQGDSVTQEILSATIEGEEIEDKGKKGDSNGESESMSIGEENMPFSPESEGKYKYTDLGMAKIAGKPMRAIAFEAKKRSEEYFDGTAWFDPETALIKRIRINYAKTPRAIRHFDATMGFIYIDGYRLMESFDMDIKGRYLLLIKFNVSIKQKYRDFKVLKG